MYTHCVHKVDELREVVPEANVHHLWAKYSCQLYPLDGVRDLRLILLSSEIHLTVYH